VCGEIEKVDGKKIEEKTRKKFKEAQTLVFLNKSFYSNSIWKGIG
jgi:hypothetical protein